jgi:hypothetical protein
VKVTLSGKGQADGTAKTDNYGEFEFEGLDADKDYTLLVEQTGYRARKIRVNTKIDTYLGEILLSRTPARNR